MRRRYRFRRIGASDQIELNMAAMLDMAFQLLAFFILTFKPAPMESIIAMRVPALAPTRSTGQTTTEPSPIAAEIGEQLRIVLKAGQNGRLAAVELENARLEAAADHGEFLRRLQQQLQNLVHQFGYRSIAIKVAPQLEYQYMVEVMDTCSNLVMPDGNRVTAIAIGADSGGTE